MRALGSFVICCVISAGCGRKAEPAKDAAPPEDELALTTAGDAEIQAQKLWWIEKTARLLRAGDGALTAEEKTRLAAMAPDAAVDEFLAGPRMSDTLVDFNMFYLGLKADALRYPDPKDPFGVYQPGILRFPQAFEGARLLAAGADPLGLVTDVLPVPAQALGAIFDFEKDAEVEDPKARRQQAYAAIRKILGELTAMYATPATIERATYCAKISELQSQGSSDIGIPFTYMNGLRADPDFIAIASPCFTFVEDGAEPPPLKLPENGAALCEAVAAKAEGVFAYLDELEADVYQPQDFASVKMLDAERLHLDERTMKRLAFGWFWGLLPNSSTNYDRKRANYVFKRFFCDDLTPIGVVLPEEHADSGHGSDPGCQSCHYKLDPMAGFFRHLGSGGSDFSKQASIFFDDGAEKSMAEYAATWTDVGYVRSATDKTLTDRGDNPDDPRLADLFTVIKRAPEAKRCFVKRMFEYVIGDQQAMDAGWLDHLATQYTQRAATDAGAAFKETVKALVLSKSFQTKDPASERCYDYAPGVVAEKRPPCKVAFLLQKHCASCHTGVGAAGGLDLSAWEEQPDGHYGFPQAGVERRESLKRIQDRLGITDPNLRMPLARFMEDGDRDAIFRWVDGQLKQGSN